MPRSMSSEMLAAITSQNLRPALFVALQFASGWAYVWSGIGSIAWNGHTWLGVGTLGTISVIEEGANVQARGITLTMSAIDPAMLADALQETQLGLPVLVYLGMFDSASPPSLIASPITSWAGRMDQPTIEISGQMATMSINCENKLLDMNVACDRRYTGEDAAAENPGDLGFQFVTSIQNCTIYWGATPASSNNI